MNEYYNEIMSLKEADEFKAVVRRWNLLSENIKLKTANSPIILPDMLWVAKSGVGRTKLLTLTAEYLSSQRNLMEFYGEVKFFEFLLNYCRPMEPFLEIQRLSDEFRNAAGFRSEFKGIVHVDISEWIDHFEEKHFITLLEYLSANSDDWLIVLSVDSDDKLKIHNLNAFLSMYLRIEKITLSLPKTDVLLEFAEEKLKKYGLCLEQDARDLLFATIEKIRNNKYFDGYNSIIMLCQDIAYKIFSSECFNSYYLTADMLTEFSCESKYVNSMIANIERVRQIGLINKG